MLMGSMMLSHVTKWATLCYTMFTEFHAVCVHMWACEFVVKMFDLSIIGTETELCTLAKCSMLLEYLPTFTPFQHHPVIFRYKSTSPMVKTSKG